jgi:hypothetical protein
MESVTPLAVVGKFVPVIVICEPGLAALGETLVMLGVPWPGGVNVGE